MKDHSGRLSESRFQIFFRRPELSRDTVVGVGWGLLAVAFWSGSFVLTRLGVKTTLSAYDITAVRFGLAGVLLLPVIWRKGFAIELLGWPGLVGLVAGVGAPYALLIAAGLQFTPASHAAALVPGLMAVISTILGVIFIANETIPSRHWLGVCLILLGSLLLGGFAPARGSSIDEHIGHALFLSAALLWSIYVIVLRRFKLESLHATSIVAVASALLYLPAYALLLPNRLAAAPLEDIVGQAIYQGALTTIVGLAAFNRAVALLGAAGGAAMPALVPVATLGLASILLHEIPSFLEVAASTLVGIGVLLVTFKVRTKPESVVTKTGE